MSKTEDLSASKGQAETRASFYLSDDGEWVPEGWDVVLADKFCVKVADGTHDSPKVSEDGYLLVTSKNIKNGRLDLSSAYLISEQDYVEVNRRSKVHKWDVLYSMIGTVGESCLVTNEPEFAIKNVGLFKNKSESHGKWLNYYLKSPQAIAHLNSRLGGTTQKYITLGYLRAFPIPEPPANERDSIVSVLGSLDDKIELLREQNETLEALAQTLFKRWFIDFNFPDENGKLYKDSGGNIDELEETSLDSFVDLNPIEKIDRHREYLFFDMKCLPLNELSLKVGIFKKSSSGSSFREGDTLLAKITPCLENGKTGLVQDLKGEEVARGSTEFIVLRPKENGSTCFNYCLARSSKFRDYAIRSMSGSSGRQRVPVDRVKSYSVINKPELIRYFQALVAPNFEKIKVNAQQIETLTQLRDTLLPKLMKGEIRVPVES